MDGQRRATLPLRIKSAVLLATLVLLVTFKSTIAETSSVAPEMLDAAQLNDVFFVDPDRGWAVGDRGLILSTNDGGRQWHSQPSNVACQLNSICFLDDQNGWVVGGRTHPYSQRTSGVVLRTWDGGREWKKLPALSLPALKRVKFFDTKSGAAIGASSAMYPSGVFRTDDGGRSWSGTPSHTRHEWQTGDFRDGRRGAAVGLRDDWAVLGQSTIRSTNGPRLGLAHVRRLRLASTTGGWLVGDGGLVLQTHDAGATWHRPRRTLPDYLLRYVDFHAIAVQHGNCWAAGSPGTCVLHSSDRGQTWEVFRTGQSLPIRSLMFLDESHGWAVGALGTILVTRDGGRTWRQQRGATRRAAMLALVSQPDELPLELFAQCAGNDGYVTVAEILNRCDIETPQSQPLSIDDSTHEAVVAIGASAANTAWRYPIRQPGLTMPASAIIEGWNQTNHGRGVAQLEEYVVRKIRQWRPNVIVTEAINTKNSNSLAHLVNQVVLAAAEKAANPASFAAHIEQVGLLPWKVTKVFSSTQESQSGSVQLVTTGLAPRLGRSLADAASDGKQLIASRPRLTPTMITFRLLINDLPGDVGRRDFFSGISLHPGSEARRRLAQPVASHDTLRRTIQKQRNVEQLLARNANDRGIGVSWLAQINDLTGGLGEDRAGRILYQLASSYTQAGRPELAADVLQHLTEQYQDHELSEAAAVWLVQYFASSEATWRLQRQTHVSGKLVSADQSPRSRASLIPGESLLPSQVKVIDYKTPAGSAAQVIERGKRAIALATLIERTRPGLFAEPQVRFPLAAAKRNQQSESEGKRHSNKMSQAGGSDAWSRCARAENWLSSPSGKHPPKSVFHCIKAKSKPRLDGNLDDEVWKNASPVSLNSALHDDTAWPAAAMLAHDDEFIYFAVTCRKSHDATYAKGEQPRPRDPDLSDHDRVDLLIDLDRDYATYYRLTIDHRGWTGEACLGDVTWNPNWFVASSASGGTWTVEAAIPLNELTGHAPAPRDAWAMGIQRTVPNVGFQSWTAPAAVNPCPEGFGLLMFD